MRPLRVLLVDDDAMITALLAEMLEGLGHAACGRETTEAGAVQAALRERPDLMILDVQLREGSGIDAAAAICRILPTAHILMSGDRLPAGLGRAGILQKPFMYRDLVRTIELTMGTD